MFALESDISRIFDKALPVFEYRSVSRSFSVVGPKAKRAAERFNRRIARYARYESRLQDDFYLWLDDVLRSQITLAHLASLSRDVEPHVGVLTAQELETRFSLMRRCMAVQLLVSRIDTKKLPEVLQEDLSDLLGWFSDISITGGYRK
jgi:hypothetical protein